MDDAPAYVPAPKSLINTQSATEVAAINTGITSPANAVLTSQPKPIDVSVGTPAGSRIAQVKLAPAGAPVDITRADGTVAEFAVEAVEVVQKAHFDAARVFGSTGRPELRLITCGGSYDPTARAYSANVVVYAALTGSRPA